MRAGGQARVLGEEKGEGTSGFVELGTADPQILRATDPVRSPSATHPLFLVPDPPVNSEGRVPRAGRLRAATVPSAKARGSRPTAPREDQLVNEGGTPPAGTGCLSLKIWHPPEKTTFANSSGRPSVPNQPLALRGPFLHTLRALIGPVFVRKCSCPNLRSQRGKFYMGALLKKPVPRHFSERAKVEILCERRLWSRAGRRRRGKWPARGTKQGNG